MKQLRLFLGMFVLLAVVMAACSGGQSTNEVMDDKNDAMNESSSNAEMMENQDDEMTEDPHSDNMSESSDEMMEEENAGGMEEESTAFSWLTYEFTDAATGQTFSISDFKGKVVLVETMAMWCSSCMKQQNQVRELHNLLGEREDFVGVGIGVDLNEDLAMLAAYVNTNGFDWNYSVASQEVLADISATLGGQFLNPPSTPIVIIDKDGGLHPLPFGIKSAETLLEYVETYLD
jgi:thiol-disulfide isomerase/thioredoxin